MAVRAYHEHRCLALHWADVHRYIVCPTTQDVLHLLMLYDLEQDAALAGATGLGDWMPLVGEGWADGEMPMKEFLTALDERVGVELPPECALVRALLD